MAKKYEPEYSFLYKLSELLDKYGPDATLGDIFEQSKGPYKYKCPKCNGRGYNKCMYNGYEGELPNNGFTYVFEEAYRDEKCDICNGIGYTEKEMIPCDWKVKR